MKEVNPVRKCIDMRTLLLACCCWFSFSVGSICNAETYAYDGNNRITSVDYGGGLSVNYTYDKVGNRTALVSTGTVAPNAYATNNVPIWWLEVHGFTGDMDAASRSDADQDGVATWKEWAADTDPFDSESRFVVELDQGSGDSVLAWASSSKRTYTIWSTTDLLTDSWAVVSGYENVVGTDALMQVDLNASGDGARYYKVSVNIR